MLKQLLDSGVFRVHVNYKHTSKGKLKERNNKQASE